ncbi:MAG: adenylosuccinate lyase [Alphaproteobacteria bacterium]|nr:adenylosuccinate lyase [Alphaproteobacteria bacterium]
MPVSVFDASLTRHLWSTDELRAIFDERARIQRWFDFEAALASSQAELGIIPQAAAAEIAAMATVDRIDIEAIAAEVRRIKHPLVPALRALQRLCRPEHGEYVHFGLTTQDVIDTGTTLQLKEAHQVFLRDLRAIGRELARLARRYRATPMAGRTHGVHALPITFGHKCAIWLTEAARNHERLTQLEDRVFVGSFAGAVGTQASFGPQAAALEAMVMARLGLGVAEISWHPARDRPAEYAGVLGLVGGGLARIANEVFNLQRSEVDELSEPFNEGKVGSSTMPHKRNPAVVENVVTLGRALRASVAMMQETLVQEHERDGAAYKAELKALPEACMITGAMLAQMRYVLAGLAVNEAGMRRNLDLLGGLIVSERVMFVLAERVGKQTAHELVYEAAMRSVAGGRAFTETLLEDPRIREALTGAELAEALDPARYVGLAPEIVDRVLEETRASGWLD